MYEVEDAGKPKRQHYGPGKSKYPWKTIKLWQSFFVPDAENRSIQAQASAAGKKYGIKFTCRKEVANGVSGIRVYRIA